MHSGYVPLRIFSSFTMLDGAIDPKAIAAQAKANAFPAAGLTDRNGLYAAMAFSDAAKKAGVQPIIGTMLGVARPDMPDNVAPMVDWIALYAQDMTGYDNLCALVSAAHLDRPIELAAHVGFDTLEAFSKGLIVLTAGGEGGIARLFAEGQPDRAKTYADRLQAIFGDRLYVELARRDDAIEMAAEQELIDLAYDRDLPLVATNPCCFTDSGFRDAHDAMLCIANSTYVEMDDRPKSCPEAWLKPAELMKQLFADLPEAIENTLVVAQRCAVMAPWRKPILPSLAGDREGEAAMLRRDATAGLNARLDRIAELEGEGEPGWREAYHERLKFEVDIIIQMGFPGYFLIVADFIKWAKDHDIPVGPGRGSGAGSVVAWALTITDLDPLKLGLLFERFLNPERVSMPDFDIDFCETRRGEVIRYVQEKYGRDQVAQIITFGKLKARAVLKDTGRVLQMSYGQVDRLAKLVPNHPTDPWDLKRALNGVPELAKEYANDNQVRRLLDLATKLEGLPRHSSTHAAGVVIGDRPLAQLVPLYRDPRSDMPVTQFDMKFVEGAGLVKFDFLGLKTLSVLQKAVQLLAKRGVEVDLGALAWDDEATYGLLQKGDTVGVFQLESEGMRRTLSAVRPTNFGDIIALVSLYRPGPMDNIPSFGRRKQGTEEIIYPHALLEQILSETYGIFVYQEQVMQAAQILAGYSLGGADLLRRAMGKKVKAEMDAQRAIFVKGCAEVNNIPAQKANELFDLIDKFAGYGFNKSHAAAYALLAYQTAWLKAHHPHEFYAASMCYDMALTDKLAIFVDDARRMGVTMLPPCINASQAEFDVEAHEDGLAVRYALGALKSVGEGAMEKLVVEREAGGPFASLDALAKRVDPRLMNKRQLETLASAGAFDGIEPNRAGVHAVAETVLAIAARTHEGRTSGQGGLFGETEVAGDAIKLPTGTRWTLSQRMEQEKEAFGFYFSAHPVDRHAHIAKMHGARTYTSLTELIIPDDGARIGATMAALVEDARWRTSARGKRYMMAQLSDATGQFLATCFDDSVAADLEKAAKEGDCALITVELDRRPGEEAPRVSIKRVQLFDGLASTAKFVVEVTVTDKVAFKALHAMLDPLRNGRGEVRARIEGEGGDTLLTLGRNFLLDAELASHIEDLPGVKAVAMKSSEARLALVG
ncbi:DNA polymerase III subunit alpha [Sphingomonas sanguinis]|jgi:DNA polymerase-3 subunit alpha|uniref:DNA polymerase III subunit alpha n=1 Tax=Sphingomonas sanguinis TaxID=33051 RepID=A0A7Y7UPD1_9SPHN|nr:DNA polymerase III subunit alpha [Sphingomonas sanguinis]MBZ6380441.1 DNA polymerase III subunit alpha [Sphingomonas sanguinis]NNG51653.1 DNA polymerase III subunit alpha [Sphingomonas sanguinis]NNG52318.1 DNA polymerase III subunit alpha [Sphingomonas sanguinis]NVP29744.1 DNA polymerase III subunit alpha [Sphingomonas sanguinis]